MSIEKISVPTSVKKSVTNELQYGTLTALKHVLTHNRDHLDGIEDLANGPWVENKVLTEGRAETLKNCINEVRNTAADSVQDVVEETNVVEEPAPVAKAVKQKKKPTPVATGPKRGTKKIKVDIAPRKKTIEAA